MNTFLLLILGALFVYSAVMTWYVIQWRKLCFKWRKQAFQCYEGFLRAEAMIIRILPLVRPTPGEAMAFEAEEFLAKLTQDKPPPGTVA